MARINITERTDDGPRVIGWFDPARATEYRESTTWDGSNHISDATGSQTEHEILYRTAGGRYVLHRWSQWQGTPDSYRYIEDDDSREWLLRNGHDAAVAEVFGPIEEETAPRRVGRPSEGTPVQVRIPDDDLSTVDNLARMRGVSRAEIVRQAVAQYLDNNP